MLLVSLSVKLAVLHFDCTRQTQDEPFLSWLTLRHCASSELSKDRVWGPQLASQGQTFSLSKMVNLVEAVSLYLLEQVQEALRAWVAHWVKFWQQRALGVAAPVQFSPALMQKVQPPRIHSPQFSEELQVTLGVLMTVGFGEMTRVPFDELFEG
ncbi:hypothetical protein FGO68_gene1139 [Halteria grandinella]|uniref:Uncharacterized protein n=1 Tax=Halteria grandinella TaxID=5974 RepID=A0A8J8NH10_HALGN|nr:hypothetical protein FGO68_gene1139 [Halteria grandinella]